MPFDAVREFSKVHGPGSDMGPASSFSVSAALMLDEQGAVLPSPLLFPQGKMYSGLGDLTYSANMV